jgi:hypothetical protein
LGARIADGEDELFWTGFFDDLKDRGLSGYPSSKSLLNKLLIYLELI